MSRISGNRPVPIQPQNDMLTAILGAAIVVQLIVLVVLVVRSYSIFEGGLFGK
jgi:hypothetical protein